MRASVSNGTRGHSGSSDAEAPDSGELLDVASAASYLGVNETFIRRLVHERRIRYYKVGKFVRFRPGDLDAFVSAGAVDPRPVAGTSPIAPRRRR